MSQKFNNKSNHNGGQQFRDDISWVPRQHGAKCKGSKVKKIIAYRFFQSWRLEFDNFARRNQIGFASCCNTPQTLRIDSFPLVLELQLSVKD